MHKCTIFARTRTHLQTARQASESSAALKSESFASAKESYISGKEPVTSEPSIEVNKQQQTDPAALKLDANPDTCVETPVPVPSPLVLSAVCVGGEGGSGGGGGSDGEGEYIPTLTKRKGQGAHFKNNIQMKYDLDLHAALEGGNGDEEEWVEGEEGEGEGNFRGAAKHEVSFQVLAKTSSWQVRCVLDCVTHKIGRGAMCVCVACTRNFLHTCTQYTLVHILLV